MREVEKDPEERRKRRLAEDILFLGDNNTFDYSMKRLKNIGTSVKDNPMGEGPSGFHGTSDSDTVSFVTMLQC